MEQHQDAKRKKRHWAIKLGVTLLALFLLAGASLAVAMWYYNPERHFATVTHPVLGTPSAAPASVATGQAQGSSKGTTATSNPANSRQGSSEQQTASFNVLILGIDSPGDADSRTDVIMVAHVNPHDKTVNLVSVPRDTRVNLPGVGMTKINHAHFLGNLQSGNHGGTESSLQAVSNFLNVPINYYVKTNFQGFTHFVDEIGGVDVTFPQKMKYTPSGHIHLNGEQALIAVRERYALPNGDIGREADQEIVLKAMLEKILQPANIPKIPSLYKSVRQDLIDTNFTDSDLLSLALLFKGFQSSQIHYEQIPGQTGTAYDPLVKMDLSYWIPDLNAVHQISDTYLHDH